MASTRHSTVRGGGWRAAGAAWTASTLAFVVAGACLAYATATEVGRLTRLAAPTPPEVVEDVIVRNARDEQGHRASFRILLFTDEFRWEMSSASALESGSEPSFTPEMRKVLNSAREVIVVGASSEEIVPGLSSDDGRDREEARAARRAGQIARWVGDALEQPIPVRKLNVGHHRATDAARNTSDQRRMVIILVLDRDRDADMDQALRAAMSAESAKTPIFETLLTRYSLTSGDSFAWVE